MNGLNDRPVILVIAIVQRQNECTVVLSIAGDVSREFILKLRDEFAGTRDPGA